MRDNSTEAGLAKEQHLREVNEALLISSVRLQEETERAEKAVTDLKASQILLETALSAGSVATGVWDIVNDVMFADDQMAEMFGIERDHSDALPQIVFISAIHPDDRPRAEEAIARTLEADDPYEIEYRVKNRSGEYRWVYVRGTVERDAAGKPLRFPAALVDITDLKKATEAKYFLASIIESSRDSIITVDFDSTITSWNHAAESLYGYTAAEAIGKSLSMLLLPADLVEIFHDVDKVRLGEAVEMFETIRLNKNGRLLDLEVVMSPVKDSAARVVGVSTIVRDIGERLKSEEALRISDQRFRVAVDAIDSIVWTNNARGEMEGEQPDWEKFTGQTYDEYQGFGWAKAVHPNDAQPTIDAWNMAVSRKETFVFEHRIRNRHGEWRVCSIRGVPVLTDEGEVSEWVGVHTDITERKQTEEALRRSREELEDRVLERTAELMSANDKFKTENQKRLQAEEERVGILSRLVTSQEDERRRIGRDLHDGIGQQITALRLKLEALLQECGESHQLFEKVVQVKEFAKQIDAAVSSVSYELRPLGLEDLGLRVSLNDYVCHWSDYHRIPAEFRASQTERRPLSAEANSHVYRIVQEALNNVLKHAKATSVSVLLNFQDGNLILIIEDNGVGFQPADIRKAASRRGGLGLVGMRERCSLLGGQMTIESEAGKGTLILCRIPVEATRTRANAD